MRLKKFFQSTLGLPLPVRNFLSRCPLWETSTATMLSGAPIFIFIPRRSLYVSSLESSETSEYVEPVYELDYFDSFSIGESLSQSSDIEVNTEKEEVVAESKPKKEVYIIGGDYFSNSDFEGLSKDGMDSFNLLTAPEPQSPKEEFVASEFTDEFYYTETLARIYAQQELYERAIEVYDKLILLYPEKSAYFATLKTEIKKHL